MEPAAMLVGAFQVQVSTRATGMAEVVRTAQHVPVGGTGVKPDVQGVTDLVVVGSFIAQQLSSVKLEPSLYTLLLDTLGHLFHQLGSSRVQLTRGLVQE